MPDASAQPASYAGGPRPMDMVQALARDLLAGLQERNPVSEARHRHAHARRRADHTTFDVTLDAALTTIVRECGLRTVEHAAHLFDARLRPGDDHGAFWYDVATDRVLSHWVPTYAEAQRVHEQEGGYLVPYKHHCAVAPRGYIEVIGLDPDADAWAHVGYDLAQPANREAYRHLVVQRIAIIQQQERYSRTTRRTTGADAHHVRQPGIYAVRCQPTGAVWVGTNPTLYAARNQIWFMLRHGVHPNTSLQAAWDEHGERAFRFDVLERYDGDIPPEGLRGWYRTHRQHWVRTLDAERIV